jgi:hypothetical protein
MFKTVSRNRGTGGVVRVYGDDEEEVKAQAKLIKEGIDPYKSPHVGWVHIVTSKKGTKYFAVDVTYYGLD